MTDHTARSAFLVCALSVGLALLLSACGPQAGAPVAGNVQVAREATATSGPGPFVMPVERLVVPETLVPRRGESEVAITNDIRRAFGPMLAEVSVVATSFETDPMFASPGDWYDFKVQYRLADCPVLISTYLGLTGLTGCGLVPPLTQFPDTPAGRDWMSGERFRVLLRAYDKVSDKPFGGLESYPTASRRNLSRVLPWGKSTATIAGKTRSLADLWVVTPGAETKAEFARLYHDGSETSGFVFSYPEGGSPEFLGAVEGLGTFTILLPR